MGMGLEMQMQMKAAIVPRKYGGVWGYCSICSHEDSEEIILGDLKWLVAWDRATKWDYCQDCVNDALTADALLVNAGNLLNMRHPHGCGEIPPR